MTAGPVIRSSLALAAFLALCGCGPRYVWVKDVSQDELNRDRYECERDMRAGAMSFGTGIVGQINANDFMGRCFQAKGYRLQQVNRDGSIPADQLRVNPPRDPQGPKRAECINQCAANGNGPDCFTGCRIMYDE